MESAFEKGKRLWGSLLTCRHTLACLSLTCLLSPPGLTVRINIDLCLQRESHAFPDLWRGTRTGAFSFCLSCLLLCCSSVLRLLPRALHCLLYPRLSQLAAGRGWARRTVFEAVLPALVLPDSSSRETALLAGLVGDSQGHVRGKPRAGFLQAFSWQATKEKVAFPL